MRRILQRVHQLDVSPGTIFDLGAAQGDWSRLATTEFPAACLMMIEPLEERRRQLEEFTCQHPQANVEFAVAGPNDGQIEFNVADDLDGSGVYADDEGNKRLVPMVRLDSLARQKSLPGPFLLKFDTHGFEQEILKGARGIIEETECVVMECYTFHVSPSSILFWQMCEVMDNLGFRVADMADPWPRKYDGLLWQMDLVWLRKENPAFKHESYS